MSNDQTITALLFSGKGPLYSTDRVYLLFCSGLSVNFGSNLLDNILEKHSFHVLPLIFEKPFSIIPSCYFIF